MARFSLALCVSSALCAALMLVPTSKVGAQDPTARYDKVRTIKIGGEGGWDFLEVDAANRKLYVARGTRVVVVDLETEKVVGEIADTPGVHGIAFVPKLNRGFTSNGGDSTVTAFDLKTLKTLGKVKANGRPDIICFEPVSNRVLSFNHQSNDITAIDPESMLAVGSLAAEGVPELAVSDDRGHVWVNLEEIRRLAEFRGQSRETFSLAFVRQVGTRYSLKEKPGGDCVFWDKSVGCTVYPARPVQCQTWPFWPENVESPETWDQVKSVCPGSGKGQLFTVEEIRASASRVHTV